ncbi:hypothetical protein BG844_15660 [Couchioplanes caeruleus subsp. caeruleus]|uniref:Uncharacterized protein n=1 Tax=Couchioplanes caeruleus subsp. caeruleus TaxID=56427 RepID=A0A1K0GM11_9ACTN|nr:hypothetical protein BG844_15660 [Couchioplanes caeruleus subsp. caeruleus]
MGEFGERSRDPLYRGGVDGEFVVTAAQVLQEGVPGDHDLRCAIGLQSAQRMSMRWARRVFSNYAFTGISRRHLHLLVTELRPAWRAGREGRLHGP